MKAKVTQICVFTEDKVVKEIENVVFVSQTFDLITIQFIDSHIKPRILTYDASKTKIIIENKGE